MDFHGGIILQTEIKGDNLPKEPKPNQKILTTDVELGEAYKKGIE